MSEQTETAARGEANTPVGHRLWWTIIVTPCANTRSKLERIHFVTNVLIVCVWTLLSVVQNLHPTHRRLQSRGTLAAAHGQTKPIHNVNFTCKIARWQMTQAEGISNPSPKLGVVGTGIREAASNYPLSPLRRYYLLFSSSTDIPFCNLMKLQTSLYQSPSLAEKSSTYVTKLLKWGTLCTMLIQLLGSKNGCGGTMPEGGIYAGQNEKYYFRWVVSAASPYHLQGKLSINASRLDVPDVNSVFCDDVSYWQGASPYYTMDLDRDNEGLISLSNKLGINPRDWWGFAHDTFWIEAFGVRLELVD